MLKHMERELEEEAAIREAKAKADADVLSSIVPTGRRERAGRRRRRAGGGGDKPQVPENALVG